MELFVYLSFIIIVGIAVKVFLLPQKPDLKFTGDSLQQKLNAMANDLKANLEKIIQAQNEQKEFTQKNTQLLLNKMEAVNSEAQESMNRLREMLRNEFNALSQDLKIMDGDQKLALEKAINTIVGRIGETHKISFERVHTNLSELEKRVTGVNQELKDGVESNFKALKSGLEGTIGRLDEDLRGKLESNLGEIRSNLAIHSGKMENLYGEAVKGFELIEARVDSRSQILLQSEIMVRDIYQRMESIEEAMTLSLARDIVAVVEDNARYGT